MRCCCCMADSRSARAAPRARRRASAIPQRRVEEERRRGGRGGMTEREREREKDKKGNCGSAVLAISGGPGAQGLEKRRASVYLHSVQRPLAAAARGTEEAGEGRALRASSPYNELPSPPPSAYRSLSLSLSRLPAYCHRTRLATPTARLLWRLMRGRPALLLLVVVAPL